MSWINSRQFKIANRNGRHYVFRRNNAGNTEINIPKTITTKAEAVRWLKAHPNKVAKPNRYRAKRPVIKLPAHVASAFNPFAVDAFPLNTRQSPGYFFRYSSPRYAGVPSPAKTSTPKTNLSAANFKRSLRNIVSIGSGRQGRAYVARQGKSQFVLKIAPYDKLAKSRGEKQPGDIEYDINLACMKAAPEGVIKVYSHIHALNFVPETNLKNIKNLNKPHFELSKQNVIVMELCEGGALEKWLDSHKPSDDLMLRIIKQVLTTLQTLMAKYPHFRHNDLHLENVFVSRSRGFLIADFGWARLKEKGTNPAVNTANGTSTASCYGVGPKTNTRYDMHLFLNNIREKCLKNAELVPKTLKFLNAVLPAGYRGKSDTHVNDFRLKYDDPCPDLPSLTKVLSHPFLKQKLVTSPELAQAKARLRKVIASPKKKTYTNAELIALTRNQLFKLSPKTRTRAVKLRANARKHINNKKKTNRVATTVTGGLVIPKPRNVVVTAKILRSNKFNKFVNSIFKAKGSENWNAARNEAIQKIENRLRRNLPAFSPSPPKPKPKAKAKPRAKPKAKAKSPSPPKARNLNYKLSPSSGRVKIKAPNTGRYVYANGSSVSLEYLKSLAVRLHVNIKGLRSKKNIAHRIFSVNTK
jgi:Protein kinase domain